MNSSSEINDLYIKYSKNLSKIVTITDDSIIVKNKLSKKITSVLFSFGLIVIGFYLFSIIFELFTKGEYISFIGGIFFSLLFIYSALESLYKSFLYYIFDTKNGNVVKTLFGKKIDSKSLSNISLVIHEKESINYIPTSKNYILNFNDGSTYQIYSFKNTKSLEEFSEFISLVITKYVEQINEHFRDNIQYQESEFEKESIINENRDIRYYIFKENKSLSISIISFLISSILSVLTAIFYTYINYHLHALFIIIILPILLGSSIGIFSSYFLKLFKSNSKKTSLYTSIFNAFLSIYISWVSFFKISSLNQIILSPIELINQIILYSKSAYQNIIFFNVSGNWMFILWILEASTILYYSYERAKIEMNRHLLCDVCKNWFSNLELKFDIIEKNYLKKNLEKGNLSILAPIKNLQKYLRITLHNCPNCNDKYFLDACNISSGESGEKISGYIKKDISGLEINDNEYNEIIMIYKKIYNLM